MENNNKGFKVVKEEYQSKGKTYNSHFIKGQIKGIDVKVLLAPPDFGGYTVLDILFSDTNEADLIVKPYEMTNDKTGETIKGNSYFVQTVDNETGDVYECKVKPLRSSDKNLLNMLLK